jgi:protein-tyrosine-phosphatase
VVGLVYSASDLSPRCHTQPARLKLLNVLFFRVIRAEQCLQVRRGRKEMRNVLILCTANSARSILAEAILNRVGEGRFRAFSAGSHPRGTPNPQALKLLSSLGYPVEGLRSKSWDEFAAPNAPHMDLVITVCDAAAGEACPLWPGAPFRVHWGIPDPAGVPGGLDAECAAFGLAHDRLLVRMQALVALPVETMTGAELQQRLGMIAELEGATEAARAGKADDL